MGDRLTGPSKANKSCTSSTTGGKWELLFRTPKGWISQPSGDVVTLVQQRKAEPDRGIPARYTRIAVGLEDPRDIIADFQQALEKV